MKVNRQAVRLDPDPARVILRLYMPDSEPVVGEESRASLVVNRVMALPGETVKELVSRISSDFASRHDDFEETLLKHYRLAQRFIKDRNAQPDLDRQLLIGAYLTGEYALQASAFCNPSIVPAPGELSADGDQPFVMSVRAIGEGHISSIEFRLGVVDPTGAVRVDSPTGRTTIGSRTRPNYDLRHFSARLRDLDVDDGLATLILSQLNPSFTISELEAVLTDVERQYEHSRRVLETIHTTHWLAASNYVVDFPPASTVDERILVPEGPAESRGMEDARFVRFLDEDRDPVYYATYTAYNGFEILPQLIETADFRSFRVATLDGALVVEKGMALFPRRIGGDVVALSRYDGESLHLMRSDQVRSWNHAERITMPEGEWELNKMGNCGSPIETEAGWLVLTHGVGPMRVYSMGAILLDLDEPTKVIGRLPEPLLVPEGGERIGYVPNVVYSCGAMAHNNNLIIPYGISDRSVGIASVPIDDILDEMAPP